MLVETSFTLKVDAPARLRTLKTSYGIAASKSLAARALSLAPTINSFRPGVYQVGNCICDLWSMACTCQAARNHTRKGIKQADRPCPHWVALYLVGEWCPIDPDPCLYLKSVGVEQPEIIAVYCRAKLPACYPAAPQGFRILETSGETVTLENVATGTHATTESGNIQNLLPFYE